MTLADPVPAAALIVAVYNNVEALRKVFLSIENQTFRDFEVVLADDGSGPEVFELVREFQGRFPFQIRHVWHEDLGFRKTIIVNRAVVETPADFLIFIDGDCLLHHRFIERHMVRRRPGVAHFGRRVAFNAALTSRLTEADVVKRRIENPFFWWGRVVDRSTHHGFYAPWLYGLRNRTKNYALLGCNFSLFKADLLAINGYDERIIGRGLEDSNLWPRMLLAGIEGKRISQEALQYHLYHRADPVPHDAATIDTFCRPAEARTPFGIEKAAL